MSGLPVVTRRELLLGMICTSSAGNRGVETLSPRTFPWAADKGAHLARRRTFSLDPEPSGYRGVLLHRLHLALDDYWRAQDSEAALLSVRGNLRAVSAATQGRSTSADWREIHYFTAILLNAPEWRRLG